MIAADLDRDAVVAKGRFADLRHLPGFERVPVPDPDGLLAGLLQLSREDFDALRERYAATVDAGARDLVATSAGALGRLPFATGDRVVIAGDSIAADAVSWARLLARALEIHGAGVEVLHRSVSGRTTAEAIANHDLVAAAAPDWVIVALGTNDMRRHGVATGAEMASPAETERNLRALAALVSESGARPIVVAPPPLHPEVEARTRSTGTFWRPDDEAPRREAVLRAHSAAIVATLEGEEDAWMPDGIHLSVAGQRAMAREVLTGLSRIGRGAGVP